MHIRRNKQSMMAASLFTLSLHGIIMTFLFFSLSFKQHTPLNIAEVTLWDALPQVARPVVQPPPVEKVVEKKPEPVKPEPVKPPPKTPEKVEDKVDEAAIALKKKQAEEKKQKEKIDAEKKAALKKQAEEKAKKAAETKQKLLAKLQADIDKEKAKQNEAALEKLQKQALAEEQAAIDAKAKAAQAAANASIVDQYKLKIINKIRGNVNKSLCVGGNPELKFKVGLLPDGRLTGDPVITKSSGSSACDAAVERAILASSPLPLPTDKSLFSEFRNLNLTFKPNE